MQRDIEGFPTKPRILISGALPPPMGGMAAYYLTLMNSSLSEQVDMCFVQTSSQKRELSSTGTATVSNLISAIKDCLRFTRALLANHPQIAHIGTAAGLSFLKHSYCVWIAKLTKTRVLLHPHCSLLVLYQERSKMWQWIFRKVINWTNGILVLSKEWLQLNSIVTDCQVYYLPNAVDINYFSDVAEIHLRNSISKKTCKLLYLGYLGKLKGIFDLLDAALELHSQGNDFILDLVGDELALGELEMLHEIIRMNNVDEIIRIHSPAYGTKKLQFLQDADIFVYPSYHEGMPMAIIEAMACGLPIVASRIGGIPDLIRDGINGILVEPGKPEQLALALSKLTNDHELRASMGEASHQIAVDQYDIEQHVKELVQIYIRTIKLSMSRSNHRFYE